MGKLRNSSRRILIGFTGWAVLLAGVVMIPFPGPGWVVVFIGFSILAREFDWAKDAEQFAHRQYADWRRWFDRQPTYTKITFGLLTAATAAVIVWLVNGYGFLNAWLHLNLPWLESPFIR
jgi:uncharacterized protein (TIGR02611 family)